MNTKDIARVVLSAQKIRDDSFNIKEFRQAVEDHAYGISDMYRFYGVDTDDAVYKAVENSGLDDDMARLIYLLIDAHWQSMEIWAKNVLEKG